VRSLGLGRASVRSLSLEERVDTLVRFWLVQRVVQHRCCTAGAHGRSRAIGSTSRDAEEDSDTNDDTSDGTNGQGNRSDGDGRNSAVGALPAILAHTVHGDIGLGSRGRASGQWESLVNAIAMRSAVVGARLRDEYRGDEARSKVDAGGSAIGIL
jgi:hypothetical protein